MFKEKVLKTICDYKLIENGDKVVVGVSGGPDSISLLNVLNEIKNDKSILLNFEIVVAHINHNIREEAKADEEYVRNYCKANKIEFYALSADVIKIAENEKIGTEEAGRKIRYDFFEKVLKEINGNKIATAHTANDNAETVLMNIMRGSGTAGLKGIRPIRDKKFIRPLIEMTRDEIENYCDENKLNPRIDKTNFENDYTRNKIRNIVIPYIQKEFNPNILETMDRLSQVATDESKYIESQTLKMYEKLLIEKTKKQIILNLKEFNKLDKVIKNRIILLAIKGLNGSTQRIEKIHIEDIIKLCSNNVGNKFLTPNKNVKVLIKDKKIYVTSM